MLPPETLQTPTTRRLPATSLHAGCLELPGTAPGAEYTDDAGRQLCSPSCRAGQEAVSEARRSDTWTVWHFWEWSECFLTWLSARGRALYALYFVPSPASR